MHLVRLMRMCEEILQGKGVIVRRPDKEELLSIRHGAWTYEQLIEWAGNKEKELEELYKTSKLPSHPDREAIDKLCIKLVESSFQTGTDLESLEVRLNDRMFHEPNLEA